MTLKEAAEGANEMTANDRHVKAIANAIRWQATPSSVVWTQKELDANGGHSPECEGYCHPSCPIRQEDERYEKERRARVAAQVR